MGKRKSRGGLSGLSQFVLHAFKPEATVQEKQPGAVTDEPRPPKRQKTGFVNEGHRAEGLGQSAHWVEKYDVSGLVKHYTHASEVPKDLQKYFAQRERYFSRYSVPPGCLLDEEGWYSVTPELVADQIAERCRCDTILDAFCGVGGNAIAFAKTCQRVIALDTSSTRLALARHNAQIYGVADRIEFILSDYIDFAKSQTVLSHTRRARNIDVVFLSPPWGGPAYLSGLSPVSPDAPTPPPRAVPLAEEHPSYSLASIQPIHGSELFELSRQITPNIAYYLPRNTRLDEIAGLLEIPSEKARLSVQEHVEVEEEWMGSKLKALTCYFGGLVAGQENMW
ncbi:hypothetical protein H0H87_003385 [Tephrocybe sp. NHM501043]|nr:hypothetical protein H0H87_003385 [Tephrocybe sp. NHM501043]